VRSSANIEDSESFSFAGQADSFLNVKHFQEIISSLKKCWASLFSPQALLYILHMRKKGKLASLIDIEIAVIVQKMLSPQCSGVLFTANVLNNDRNQMMINSTWGLGDVVTGNIVNPDLIVIDKNNGMIVSKLIGEKEQQSIPNPKGSFTQLIAMDDKRKRECSLKHLHLEELRLLGLKLEKQLGAPQDIEWAIENDVVYALQSRPITTLRSEM
jgi:pyruvate,water dikinase